MRERRGLFGGRGIFLRATVGKARALVVQTLCGGIERLLLLRGQAIGGWRITTGGKGQRGCGGQKSKRAGI